MKLIFLYGPPGVGKLTVARELEKRTGFKIFHNHLTVDFLDPIIPYGTTGFFKLLNKIRLDIFETAATGNLSGMIFTYVYAKPHDDEFIQKTAEILKQAGGEVCFIQLTCSPQELRRRVTQPSRQEFEKIKTTEQLEKNLTEDDLLSAAPVENNFSLDITSIKPAETAQKIIEHFHLESKS